MGEEYEPFTQAEERERPAIGSDAWCARRARLWREEAEELIATLRQYEHDHPSSREWPEIPCFAAALSAAEQALARPSASGT